MEKHRVPAGPGARWSQARWNLSKRVPLGCAWDASRRRVVGSNPVSTLSLGEPNAKLCFPDLENWEC